MNTTNLRRALRWIGLSILLCSQVMPHAARAATINFDDVSSGTVIDTQYPGVTFGCTFCVSGHAFARDMLSFGSTIAASEPNVVSLIPPFNANDPNSSVLTSFNAANGAVTAVFTVPQSSVSIDARPQLPLEFLGTANNKPYLEAYSSTVQDAAHFLGRVVYPLNFGDPGYCSPAVSACGGPFRTLTFTSPSDNIVSIRLSCQQSQGGPPVYADFDNLVFRTGANLRAASAQALFASDFNSGAPQGMTFFGGARIDGGYLKLLSLPTDSFGIVYVNDFGQGQPVQGFRATFDASLFGSTCCAGGALPADGFSFNLVPAASVLANPGYGEPGEEGLSTGLTISFDTWDNGFFEAPALDVRWLGQTLAHVPFQASQSAFGIADAAAAARAVVINLDTDGTLDVSYGGVDLVTDLQTPYQASVIGVPKWVIGARIGLANDNYWFDSLAIRTYAGPTVCHDFTDGLPEGMTAFGYATVDDGALKLITVPGESHGIVYQSDFGGGRMVKAFRATFKAALFGATCCLDENGNALPADGFSFNLVPAASVRTNPQYNQPAEEGLDEGLAITFDTWDNALGEAPAVEVKWQGQTLAHAAFQASQSPLGVTDAASAWREVVIDLKTDGTLNVSYGGTPIFTELPTPFDPAAIGVPVWVLGARVGLADDNHWFDDLCLTMIPDARRPIAGLFNTGVGHDHRVLAEDDQDLHYSVRANLVPLFPVFPTYAATSENGFPIPPWLPDSTVSAWISQSTDTLMADGTTFVFGTTFDLTGLDPATATIAGRWSADNIGTLIRLNGQSIGAIPQPDFVAWQPFSIRSGFSAGINRLEFIVFNEDTGNGVNPAGVRVELWGAAASDCNSAVTPPSLAILSRAPNVEVSWSEPGFILQRAADPAGLWLDADRGLSTDGTHFTAILPSTSGAKFFRLRRECN